MKYFYNIFIKIQQEPENSELGRRQLLVLFDDVTTQKVKLQW